MSEVEITGVFEDVLGMIYSAKQIEEHHNKKRDVIVFRNTVTSLGALSH